MPVQVRPVGVAAVGEEDPRGGSRVLRLGERKRRVVVRGDVVGLDPLVQDRLHRGPERADLAGLEQAGRVAAELEGAERLRLIVGEEELQPANAQEAEISPGHRP
jgi:hypothetical protein